MGSKVYLKSCRFERASKLPDKKMTIKQGASVELRKVVDDGSSCEFEYLIKKRLENIVEIELVYVAKCIAEKGCAVEKCTPEGKEKKLRNRVSLEANLLVSNILKNMALTPFPFLLGDLDDDAENKSGQKKS